MIGAKLGPYEIVAKLGEGGMGEVYKARDPRLNRVVALKLLPAVAATDAERRERFEREAQAVAALNHPGIVTLHSVEQANGQFVNSRSSDNPVGGSRRPAIALRPAPSSGRTDRWPAPLNVW